VSELLERAGDVAKGRIVFHSTGTCTKCHVVNGLGQNVGPDLSEIGKKLSKPAFFESILYPSAAISHNYETWTVVDTNGNVTTGLLISETPDQIQLKDEKALVRTIRIADIEERKKQEISLMPADIQKLMSAQELVDVVEYMTTLKQAQAVEKAGGN
jgi:putative heme-binding domain-containing protein